MYCAFCVLAANSSYAPLKVALGNLISAPVVPLRGLVWHSDSYRRASA
jgi:hypothetical protein